MMTFRRHNHGSREASRPICEDPAERCDSCSKRIKDVFYRVVKDRFRPQERKVQDLCPPCALSGTLGKYEKFVKAPFSEAFRKVEG